MVFLAIEKINLARKRGFLFIFASRLKKDTIPHINLTLSLKYIKDLFFMDDIRKDQAKKNIHYLILIPTTRHL